MQKKKCKKIPERFLNIWCTEALRNEIKSCYDLIVKVTDKLAEESKSGIKVITKDDLNKILEQLKFKKGELPRIELVKKKDTLAIIKERASQIESDIIRYDKQADGYCLIEETNNYCINKTKHNCDKDMIKILLILH